MAELFITVSPVGLPDLPNGINDAGQIVGTFDVFGGQSLGFLDVGGTYTLFRDPNVPSTGFGFTFARGLTIAGQIVGYMAQTLSMDF